MRRAEFPDLPDDESSKQDRELDRACFETARRLRVDGELILGASGFGFRIDRDLSAVMAFEHESRTVLINTGKIEAEGMTPLEFRYTFSHEIAHFVQMASDPDTYLKTFSIAEEHRKQQPVDLQERVQDAWDSFFNVFLDIHDNSIVDRRSLWVRDLDSLSHPRATMYREKATQEDMSGRPKTEQFLFAILRKVMVPEAKVVVDQDVQSFLEQPVVYLGKKYSDFFSFARQSFFDPDLSLAVFLARLERSVSPIFERFLSQDIASGNLQKPKKNSEIGGKLSRDGKKKMAKDIKKSRQSGSDQAAANAAKRFAEAKAGEFSEAEIKKMLEIKERVDKVYWSLMDLWGVFLQTVRDVEITTESGYRSGQSVEVSEFVRQLPDFLVAPDKLKIFSRHLLEESRESTRPKQIELFLIVDLSGSMDSQKRQATQETVYALSKSLLQYQQNFRLLSEDRSAEIIKVNLRVLGFGDSSTDLLPRSPNEENDGYLNTENQEETDNRLWRSVLDIGLKDLGGTRDSESLDEVWRDLSRQSKQDQLAANDSVAVIIEITDGETTTVSQSAAVVDALKKQTGVHVCGIQIPGLLSSDTPRRPQDEAVTDEPEILSESRSFNAVWGEQGRRLNSIDQLKAVMISVLFEALLKQVSGR